MQPVYYLSESLTDFIRPSCMAPTVTGAGESKANRVCVPDLMGLVGWRNGDCAEVASCEATTLSSFRDKV